MWDVDAKLCLERYQATLIQRPPNICPGSLLCAWQLRSHASMLTHPADVVPYRHKHERATPCVGWPGIPPATS